jgi:hypothetical protein
MQCQLAGAKDVSVSDIKIIKEVLAIGLGLRGLLLGRRHWGW